MPALSPLASVSRNLTELLAGCLLLISVYVGVMMAGSVTRAGGSPPPLSGGGLDWIRPAGIAMLFLVISALVLPAQYLRRTTFASRGIIALGGLLTALVWMAIPWEPSFALQRAVGTQDAQAVPITLAYAPEIGRFQQHDGSLPVDARGDSANLVPLFLPLRVDGIATADILLIDRAVIRIRSATGKTLFESAGPVYSRKYSRLQAWKPAGAAIAPRSFLTFEQLLVPAPLFARMKNVDTAVEIDYSLTVMRAQPAQILPALGGDDIANGRRCFTRSDDEGDDVEVGCLSLKMPPSCASIYLRHDPSGAQNPPREGCQPDYAPFRLILTQRLVNRLNATIPFYDPARSVSYPVNASMLKDSHVVIVTYEAALHASRHLSIPSVRIGDWQGAP